MLTKLNGPRPAFLASVVDAREARDALAAGAQIIDCKDPSRGALGALDPEKISSIVDAVGGRAPVSATVGDRAIDATNLHDAVAATAALGVDLVKIGVYGGQSVASSVIADIGQIPIGRARLAAVLMADREPDLSLIDHLARAGFCAVMLDTSDKSRGRLLDALAPERIASFVTRARHAGILCGLAGSLRLDDIHCVAGFEPDVIGFRGALCAGGRTGHLDAARAAAVGKAMSEISLEMPNAALAAR